MLTKSRAAAVCILTFLLGLGLLQSQLWQRPNIQNLVSSHKCNHQDGPAETRICRFQDILLHRGQILYLYQGKAPAMPGIMTNWHHNLHLDVVLLDTALISNDMFNASLKPVKTATLTHRQWHLNYYHSIAESAFEVYNLACTTFKFCNLHSQQGFTPIFLDKPGIAGWDARFGESGGNWGAVLPPAAEALQCFYPTPAIWVADPDLQSTVFWIQTAVAGIGQYNRKWPGPPDTASRFRSVYKAVDTELTSRYRKGLLKCLNVKPASFRPQGPFTVSIMNREYHAGRHIINAERLSKDIQSLPEVNSCRVAQLERLSFKQQAALFAQSQVVIMTHGAALGNVLFMSPGSVAVFYNWLKIGGDPHTWVTDTISDYALGVSFVGLSTEDRKFIYPQKEKYIFQPEYGALPPEEKRALLEEGFCPGSVALQDCSDLKMNFAMDWNLLRPALETAFYNMTQQRIRILDGVESQ